MKSWLLASVLVLAATSASATTINAGRFNSATNAIELDVTYGGGCKEHKFELQVGRCMESFPVQCDVQLIDQTKDDFCEALLHETVSIKLEDTVLKDDYFNGAYLQIKSSGTPNGVLVTLPRK